MNKCESTLFFLVGVKPTGESTYCFWFDALFEFEVFVDSIFPESGCTNESHEPVCSVSSVTSPRTHITINIHKNAFFKSIYLFIFTTIETFI